MTATEKPILPEEKPSTQRWRSLVSDLQMAIDHWEKTSAQSVGQLSPDEKKLQELKQKIDQLKQQLQVFNE
jgi:septal ring factor EnvC (AmiA/AmiB activator)